MAAEATKPVRIFVNHVDEYQGYHISKYLSQCAVGATLEDNEEEEEEAGSVLSGDFPVKPKEGCYEIHGTLKKTEAKQPEFVKEILSYDTREQMYEHLVECDVIVYDITQDPDQIEEAMWALTELHQDIEKLESQKVFILLSTVMTWAKSKPADEEDLESPLTEEDYRKRKPHQNYKEHLAAEKAAVKYGKTKKSRLTTYIVASGLTYGCGENIFHSFFKAAWHNAFTLPVYGNGQNVLPMIHIRDLAAVLQNIADSKPKVKYLVAVDDSQNMLDEVVKAVSVGLCTGKIRTVTKEEAALSKDIDQATLDQLMLSLRLDAIYVKENFKINWACETGIVENIDQIIKEYKKERGLQPIKACILGPPASGKSVIVKQLCDFYKLHHIRAKDVITEAIANLQRSAARADAEEEDDDGKAAEDAETLEQGFILDGFPKTKQQAEDLFAPDEDDEEEGEDGGGPFNKRLMPDQLFVLEAGDDFLKRRVMQLPEAVVAGTHNTEEGLLRRLASTEPSTPRTTPWKFIRTYSDVSKDDSTMHAALVERIKKAIGKPRNYGLTPEEQEEIRRRRGDERLENEKREPDTSGRGARGRRRTRGSGARRSGDSSGDSVLAVLK
uniref:Nucleoside-diphosphate kinase n=1 Tax=Macrostomum lignano TaxID=282301 RepID=A0A1I8IWJ0_9PLAT